MNNYLNSITSPLAIVIADRVRQMESRGKKIAKLQTGDPHFPTPAYIVKALQTAITDGETHYSTSQGVLSIRNALSSYYKKETRQYLDADNFLICNGAVHAIYCVMHALINKGDEVAVVDPSWPQYKNIALLAGATLKEISTHNLSGRLSVELLKKNLSKNTKLVVINNPCNPTGVVYDEKEINQFVKLAKRFNCYILFDEVYAKILYTNKFKSILECSEYNGYKEKIVYINSFSKTFSMTGWRVGYAYCSDKLLPASLRISQNMITNVATFCQHAAAEALNGCDKFRSVLQEMVTKYKRRHSEIGSILSKKKFNYIIPEGAFYFFIDVKSDGIEFAKKLLKQHNIAVVPGIAYGEEFSSFIRVSFAVDNFSYNTFIHWLKQQQ